MEFIGDTLQVVGEVMIGMTAIMVHRRVWKEHKITEAVYKEMEREQTVGVIGILLVILGFIVRL